MKYITRTELFGGSILSEVDRKKGTKVYFNQSGNRTSEMTIIPNDLVTEYKRRINV